MIAILKVIIEITGVKHIVNNLYEIFKRIYKILQTPAISNYFSKIQAANVLKLLAQRLHEVADIVIPYYEVDVLKSLNYAARDRVPKVQQAAQEAKKEWDKLRDTYKNMTANAKIEEKKAVPPKEAIKTRLGIANSESKGQVVKKKFSVLKDILRLQKGIQQKSQSQDQINENKKRAETVEHWQSALHNVKFLKKRMGMGGGYLPLPSINAKQSAQQQREAQKKSIKQVILQYALEKGNKSLNKNPDIALDKKMKAKYLQPSPIAEANISPASNAKPSTAQPGFKMFEVENTAKQATASARKPPENNSKSPPIKTKKEQANDKNVELPAPLDSLIKKEPVMDPAVNKDDLLDKKLVPNKIEENENEQVNKNPPPQKIEENKKEMPVNIQEKIPEEDKANNNEDIASLPQDFDTNPANDPKIQSNETQDLNNQPEELAADAFNNNREDIIEGNIQAKQPDSPEIKTSEVINSQEIDNPISIKMENPGNGFEQKINPTDIRDNEEEKMLHQEEEAINSTVSVDHQKESKVEITNKVSKEPQAKPVSSETNKIIKEQVKTNLQAENENKTIKETELNEDVKEIETKKLQKENIDVPKDAISEYVYDPTLQKEARSNLIKPIDPPKLEMKNQISDLEKKSPVNKQIPEIINKQVESESEKDIVAQDIVTKQTTASKHPKDAILQNQRQLTEKAIPHDKSNFEQFKQINALQIIEEVKEPMNYQIKETFKQVDDPDQDVDQTVGEQILSNNKTLITKENNMPSKVLDSQAIPQATQEWINVCQQLNKGKIETAYQTALDNSNF